MKRIRIKINEFLKIRFSKNVKWCLIWKIIVTNPNPAAKTTLLNFTVINKADNIATKVMY